MRIYKLVIFNNKAGNEIINQAYHTVTYLIPKSSPQYVMLDWWHPKFLNHLNDSHVKHNNLIVTMEG